MQLCRGSGHFCTKLAALTLGVGDGAGDQLNAELFVGGDGPLTSSGNRCLGLHDLNCVFPGLGIGKSWSWRSKLKP